MRVHNIRLTLENLGITQQHEVTQVFDYSVYPRVDTLPWSTFHHFSSTLHQRFVTYFHLKQCQKIKNTNLASAKYTI